MLPVHLHIKANLFADPESLPEGVRDVYTAAYHALDQAYAPYSGFQVAAALRLANGMILTGTNQENAAYPSGLCAERTVLYYAGSVHAGETILELVVLARKKGETSILPACPCGGCRQVMVESEARQKSPIRVFFRQNESGILGLDSVSDLMPFKFDTVFH